MTVDDDEGDGDRGNEGDDNDDEGDGDGDGDEGDNEGDDGHESRTHDDHGTMTMTTWPRWMTDNGDNDMATKDNDDVTPMVNAMARR